MFLLERCVCSVLKTTNCKSVLLNPPSLFKLNASFVFAFFLSSLESFIGAQAPSTTNGLMYSGYRFSKPPCVPPTGPHSGGASESCQPGCSDRPASD